MSDVGRKGGCLALAFLMCWASFLGMSVTLFPSAAAGTVVSGHITTNTTWNESNSPYWVVGTVYVDSGVTLTIEEGVSVLFDSGVYFIVRGEVNSLGTPNKRVTFSSNNSKPSIGDWGYLEVLNQGKAHILYTNITFGSGVYISSSQGSTIGYSQIAYNHEGIATYDSSGHMFYNNTIEYNDVLGIQINGTSSGSMIRNSIIRNNKYYGIEFVLADSSKSTVSDNEIYGNGYGIYVWDTSGWEITCNYVGGNRYRGFDLAMSDFYIHHNNIMNPSANARDNRNHTRWDDRSQGNYWSDYNGSDSDGDGIGDTPYFIPTQNQDNYPFMDPVAGCPVGGAPPVAIAKPTHQTVAIGQDAWFNGSDSYDPDGWIVSYHWLFGDGGSAWGENVSHAYTTPGNYSVTLTVKDDDGLTAKDQVSVTVEGDWPVADAGPDQVVEINETVELNGSASYDPDGTIVDWLWDFGDGSPQKRGEIVYHIYVNSGNYTATLWVTDNDNLTDSDTALIDVLPLIPPVADAGPDHVVHAKQTVEFNGSGSYDTDGFIVDWLWDFGDGSPQKHGEMVNHTYNTQGNYTATLWVTDNDNLTDSDTVLIDVLPELLPPVSDPNGPYSGRKNFAVHLSGNNSHDPDGNIVELEWNFGDGSPKAQGWWVSHVYSSGGNFTITLTVTDNDNLTDTAATYAVISDEPPGEARVQDAALTGGSLANVIIYWSLSPDDGGIENDVVAYEIYYGTSYDRNGAGYALLETVPAGTHAYTHSGGGHGDNNSYFYVVKAVDNIGQRTFGQQQAVKFARHMPAGMQLISIPVNMSNTSIQKVFQTASYKRILYYDAMAGKRHNWRTFDTRKPYNSLTNVDEKMALWVEVSQECYLTVAGLIPLSTTISLVVGWNFIGYASYIDRTVSNSFAGAIYQKVEGYDASDPPWYLKRLTNSDIMQFGNGYWIHVSESFDWTVTN